MGKPNQGFTPEKVNKAAGIRAQTSTTEEGRLVFSVF